MDKDKIENLNINKNSARKNSENEITSRESFMHTNPILGRMFSIGLIGREKRRFKISDWFK